MVEKNTSDDIIYNWRNELKGHSSGMKVVANSQALKFKNQGFNKDEVVELLAAENFDLDLANRVASNLFDENNQKKAQEEVPVVATKYSECAPVIERTLQKLSAKEFVNKLTQGDHAIVKVDNKTYDSWKRMADLAKRSFNARLSLHNELRPWVEEVLLNSVMIAEKNESSIKVASKNKYVVSLKHGTAEVDLEKGTSSSQRFVEGNYEMFGLADEFLVKAADSASPYERLRKAL